MAWWVNLDIFDPFRSISQDNLYFQYKKINAWLHLIECFQNEELITSIHEESPVHQIQAHVVEDIISQPMTELTDVKEVIDHLIPTRKRKPRTKKRKSENTCKSNDALNEAMQANNLIVWMSYF